MALDAATVRQTELFGHPRGLTYLFTTEMGERFSYYGMRAILVLYWSQRLLQPDRRDVIGYDAMKALFEFLFGPLGVQPLSSHIYGLYTAFVYLTPFFGGMIADRWLGQRYTVIVGGVIMAIGHFLMTFEPLFLFALSLLIIGNGSFKPNISTQVGDLYKPGDPRARPRLLDLLRRHQCRRVLLAAGLRHARRRIRLVHCGFFAAGIGMLIGTLIYLSRCARCPGPHRATAGQDRREEAARPRRVESASSRSSLLFLPITLFWAIYEQQGNTISAVGRHASPTAI